MAVGLAFTPTHVSSFAARGAELERLGEERQDPHALMRAARLYTLAIRIADDIDKRPAPPFTVADLTRVRTELRTLATDAAASGMLGDHGIAPERSAGASDDLTRAFREVALRIEQRIAGSSHGERPGLRSEA